MRERVRGGHTDKGWRDVGRKSKGAMEGCVEVSKVMEDD